MMRLVSGAGMPDRPLFVGVTDLQRKTGRNVVMWLTVAVARSIVDLTVHLQRLRLL